VHDHRQCDICGGEWHGLPGTGPAQFVVSGPLGAEGYEQIGNGGRPGCPGAYATEQQIDAWRASQHPVGCRFDRHGQCVFAGCANLGRPAVVSCSGYGPAPQIDPDDPAVIAAIDLVRWELSLVIESPHRGRAGEDAAVGT
jgi:hypothetical protein